jgi:hypothetical protein
MSANIHSAGPFHSFVATMAFFSVVVSTLTETVNGAAAGSSPRPVLGESKAKPHWAFQPLRSIDPPVQPKGWSEHPVDRFIFAKLSEQGLKPVAASDKRTLGRRVYFDLIGLPPTPDELERYLKDKSPDAYPRLIERLLASPRYGERWGRHWMDVVRYADTAGDNADYPVPEARLYRDYIIEAFNRDKPYDQFVQEQLAGGTVRANAPDAGRHHRHDRPDFSRADAPLRALSRS